jgi:hypothetical protein
MSTEGGNTRVDEVISLSPSTPVLPKIGETCLRCDPSSMRAWLRDGSCDIDTCPLYRKRD